MSKFKTFMYLFIALSNFFTLGGYSYASMRNIEIIELHRWVITSSLGLIFLFWFLISYKKMESYGN